MTPAEPSVAFAYPADDAPEIDATAAVYQRAVEFAFGLINRSRTEQAARVRLAAARYVITARYEKPDRICKRLKISKRRFFELPAGLAESCANDSPCSFSPTGGVGISPPTNQLWVRRNLKPAAETCSRADIVIVILLT
jgi:hypothetical protein